MSNLNFFITTACNFLCFALLSLLLSDVIRSQSPDETYITSPNGGRVLFEGQIAPSYPILLFGDRKKENFDNNFYGELIITPEVLLKMYRSQSRPVKSPSYMPKATFSVSWKSSSISMSPYFTIGHHSNGQAGNPFIEDSIADEKEINTESGSFATNFLELGYRFSFSNARNHVFGLSYQLHPVHGWWFRIDEDIKNIYGRKRLNYFYQYAGKNFQADLSYIKIYDEFELAPGVSSHIYSATARIRIPIFKNLVWGFVNYYQGQDYYNIHFTEEVKQVRMGIAIHTGLIMK